MNRICVLVVVALVSVQQAAALDPDALQELLDPKLRSAISADERCSAYEAAFRSGPHRGNVENQNRHQVLESIVEAFGHRNPLFVPPEAVQVLDDVRQCLLASTGPGFGLSGTGSDSSLKARSNLQPLEYLLASKFEVPSSVEGRCSVYETWLRNGFYGEEMAHLNRDQVLQAILDSANHRDLETKPEEAGRILNDVRQCLTPGGVSVESNPSPNLSLGPLGQVFDRSQLVDLSKAYQEMKGLPLDHRCKLFDEKLRGIMQASGNPLASASKAVLFQQVIAQLSGRQLPFNNKQPFLIALEECPSNLSDYQLGSDPIRNVIAGPLPANSLAPPAADLMKKAHEEFKEVRNNIKDVGQDLYNKNEVGPNFEHRHELSEHHESHSFSHQDNHSGGLHSSTSQLHNQLISNEPQQNLPHGSVSQHSNQPSELPLKARHDVSLNHNDEHKIHGHHGGHESDELRLNDHHPFEKHDHENLGVRELEERLRTQVKRTISLESEIEHANLVRSELEQQVLDLQRQLTVAQEGLHIGHKNHDRHHDYSDSDDDDDDDDDDEHSIGDVIRDSRNKKDKKQNDKKARKDKKKKKEEDEEKVYKEPVDIARKLQSLINSSESSENRCQKYYMAVNHGGKATKKFLKMVAKLRLPKTINQDPEYFESLSRLAQQLANSGLKNAQHAARELQQCLVNKPDQPAGAHFHSSSVQHHSHGPHQVPVIDSRTKHHEFSHRDRFQPQPQPPVVEKFFHSKTHQVPVTYGFSNKGQRNWSYSHASSIASGQSGPLFDFPTF